MSASGVDISRFLQALSERSVSFLRDELEIAVTVQTHHLDDVQKLDLKHLTAIMSATDNMKLYLAYSFDEALIVKAFEAYCKDLDIAPDERDTYMEETAGDIINIIVGNALADLSAQGRVIGLSPPIVITEAKSVMRHRGAKFATACLVTPYGGLNIHLIGPGELFDDTLEYLEA
ncbi:MAG: chemotaxis protein CheX [Desulfovibrionaceae bacterium]|nr:chemotaxis protein CheX [Desulfovibrionaceae bacterium]